MIRLRVVGWSDDHELLLLSNKPRGKQPSHAIAIDQKLMGTLQDVVYARRDVARDERRAVRDASRPPSPTSKVSPSEMQRLMRSGQSAEQVAKAAGVDLGYVEQFLVPVLYEREGIVRDAQALFQIKAKLGASGMALGDAVQRHLASRHVRPDETGAAGTWSATRREGESWLVTISFPFRGRSRTAKWRLDQVERAVVPLNELARDIGWIAPGKSGKRAPVVVEVGTAKRTARKPAKKKSVARKPAKKKPVRKKSVARKPVRKPVRKAAARKPARKKASVRKKPVARKPVARKPAKKKPVRKKSVARKPVRKPVRKAAARKKPAVRKPTRRAPSRARTRRR